MLKLFKALPKNIWKYHILGKKLIFELNKTIDCYENFKNITINHYGDIYAYCVLYVYPMHYIYVYIYRYIYIYIYVYVYVYLNIIHYGDIFTNKPNPLFMQSWL